MAASGHTRERILDEALRQLTAGGRESVSTRSITSALGIQAPTLYRIFGDKQGLLDAVALHGFTAHLESWTGPPPGADPVDTLRGGWDMHIAWGVANPHLYAIAYGDARPGVSSPAADAIDAILVTLVDQVARAGRLAVPAADAVRTLRALGTGVVLTLVALPPGTRDPRLSDRGRDLALSAILTDGGATARPGATGAAAQLRGELDGVHALSAHERGLLGEWLDRIGGGPA